MNIRIQKPKYKGLYMVNRKAKIPNNEHISSIVSSWSFMVAQPVLLNPIEVIVPNNSKGFSIHINSEAKASFQSVVFPSSLLAFFPWIHIFERTNFIHNGHPWIKVFKKPSFLYCSSSSYSSFLFVSFRFMTHLLVTHMCIRC